MERGPESYDPSLRPMSRPYNHVTNGRTLPLATTTFIQPNTYSMHSSDGHHSIRAASPISSYQLVEYFSEITMNTTADGDWVVVEDLDISSTGCMCFSATHENDDCIALIISVTHHSNLADTSLFGIAFDEKTISYVTKAFLSFVFVCVFCFRSFLLSFFPFFLCSLNFIPSFFLPSSFLLSLPSFFLLSFLH